MALTPNKVTATLEGIAGESKARVIGVKPLKEYIDGVVSEKQIGYTYEVLAEKNGFEKFSVKTSDLVPVITNEQIAESSEPVYINFSPDFAGRFYFSKHTNSWELSAKASKAILIKPQIKPL